MLSLILGLLLALTRRASAQSPAQETFALVNQVRADHGLAPFQWNDTLARAAQWQAEYIAANNLYSHTGEGGTRPQDRANAVGYQGYVVENFVAGWQLTPQQGVTWWINSPVHYNTLITTRYYEAGVGYAFGNDQHWYVLVVGRRSDQPVSATASQPAPADPPALVAPIILSEPREDGSIVHVVQEGQTLWAIAARYEVRLDDLLLYNNLSENSVLRPGDELIIRLAEGQLPPPTPTPPLTHIVREGETAWTIAARYQLSLADFFWYNGLDEEAILQPGDEVTVRLAPGQTPPPTPTPQTLYVVKTGDTLLGIAARYGLTLEQLLAYNGLTADAILRPGDELRLIPAVTPTPPPEESGPTPTLTPPGTAVALEAAASPSPAVLVTPILEKTPVSARSEAPSPTAAPATAAPAVGKGFDPVLGGVVIFLVVGLIVWVVRNSRD